MDSEAVSAGSTSRSANDVEALPAARTARAAASIRPPGVRRGWEDGAILAAMVLLAATFYLAPWPAVYMPALLLLAALTLSRLDLSLALVPLFVPYFMVPKDMGPHRSFPPAEIFLLLDLAVAVLYLLWPARRQRANWAAIARSPFLLPTGLFLLAATASTLLAADRHDALRYYRWTVLEPLAYFVLLLVFLPVKLTTAELLRPRGAAPTCSTQAVGPMDGDGVRGWNLVLGALVVSGVVLAIVSLWQFAAGHNLTFAAGSSIGRVKALYGSPDNLGLFYDRVIPVCLALGLAVLGAARRLTAPVWGAALLLLLASLGLTFSRGAWLAVAAGCLLVLVLLFPWGRWLALACAALAVLALVIAGPRLIHAFQAGHANTVQRRLDLWQSSLAMIRDYPLLGVGPDNFLHYYAPTRKENLWQRECAPGLGYIQPGAGAEPCLSHPHDEILDFWLSTGILGLLAFVWLQTVFWRSALGSLRPSGRRLPLLASHRSSDSAARAGGASTGDAHWNAILLCGAMGAMLAALVHGLVDEIYFLPDLAVVFWLLCGYVSWVRAAR